MSLLLNSMTIVEARDGGFMVIQDIDPGIRNHPLFAGPLGDCLAYMAKMLRRDEAPAAAKTPLCSKCGADFPWIDGIQCFDSACPSRPVPHRAEKFDAQS